VDPTRYRRLRDLVHGAAERPAAGRAAWLAERCADDPTLAVEAVALLQAQAVSTQSLVPAQAPTGAGAARLVVPVGTRLGRWTVSGEIGRGGMGIVLAVKDEASGAEAALKLILPHLHATPGARERFRREARVGIAVQHENVVRTLEVGEAEVAGATLDYLVMERVRGRTLRQMLRELGSLPEALLREIARQTALGLAALHAAGVVHRDVKPENVVLADDGRVRLMDLGVAKVAGGTGGLTVEGQFVGSPAYAAPEQCQGRVVGPPADLYALGAVLYELASGRPPFDALDPIALLRAHIEVNPVPLAERVPALSDFVSAVVATLLSKEPAARFASAAALADTLANGESDEWWLAQPRRPRGAGVPRATAPQAQRPVGRDREREALAQAWREARAGAGGAFLLDGEAGIGKTRLLDDLAASVASEDAVVLRTGFVPAGEAVGLGAALASYWGRSLAYEIDRRLGLPAPLATALAAWMQRSEQPAGDDARAPASADLLLARLLRSLADERPVLWLVEDLHFADPAARHTTLGLARTATQRRVLLLVSTRPGLDPATRAALGALPGARSLTLERLGAPAVGALIGQRVADAGLARRLARTLTPRTDGIPFFVLETLRDLERRGHLVRRADGLLHEGAALDPRDPPRALQDVVRARLASVPAADRAWLDLAAVEGFEFDPALLARARGAAPLEVLESLGRLERAHGVVRSEARLVRFDHHLLQEVLYADLPAALRAALHDALAAAAEATAVGGAAPSELAVRAARHRLRGSDPAAARPWVDAALRHLAAVGRSTERVDLALEALRVPGLLEGAERFQHLLTAARAAREVSRRADEAQLLDEAERLAAQSGDASWVARVALQRGYQRSAAGAYDEAIVLARRAAAGLAGVNEEQHVQALGLEGKALWCLGRLEEARAQHERALARATAYASPAAQGRAEADLAIVLQELGHASEAEERQRRAADLLRAHGDRRNLLITLLGLANTIVSLGRFHDALARYDEVIAEARRHGWLDDEAVGWVNAAEALLRVGRLSDARQALESSLDLARETGEPRVEGYALHGLGLHAMWTGDTASARRRLEEAERLRRAIDNRIALSETLQRLADLDLAEAHHDRAAARYDEALRIAHAASDPNAALLCLVGKAQLPGGDSGPARRLLAAEEPRLRLDLRLEARWRLWRASRDPADRAAACRVLAEHRAVLPPTAQAAFLEHVPYARDLLG
jgi:tetratricopeptide (TPR) repeat protein